MAYIGGIYLVVIILNGLIGGLFVAALLWMFITRINTYPKFLLTWTVSGFFVAIVSAAFFS